MNNRATSQAAVPPRAAKTPSCQAKIAARLFQIYRNIARLSLALGLVFTAVFTNVHAVDGSLEKFLSVKLPASTGGCSLDLVDSGSQSYVGVFSVGDSAKRHAGGKVVSGGKVRPGVGGSAGKLESNCFLNNVTVTHDTFSGANTRNNATASGVDLIEFGFSYIGTDGLPYYALATLSADSQSGASTGASVDVWSMVKSFTRQSPATSPGTADTATFSLNFAGEVTNLDEADFSTTAGSLSMQSLDSGASYLLTVSEIAEGETATLRFVASQNIVWSQQNIPLPMPSKTVSYQRMSSIAVPTPAPSPPTRNTASPLASGTMQAAAYLIGDLQGRQAQGQYSARIQNRFAGQLNGASTAFAMQPLAVSQDWTAVNSNEVWALMSDYNRARTNDKLADLGPDSAALAARLIDETSTFNEARLSVYADQGWGTITGNGLASFEGEASSSSMGADYLLSPDLLIGGGLAYEYANLDFAQDLDGWVKKEGWRADLYAGWRASDTLLLEGWGSYGTFDNRMLSAGATSTSQSERILAGGRLTGQLEGLGMTLEPYAQLSYLCEHTQAFQDSSGTRFDATISEMSRGAGALRLSGGPDRAILGLVPYVSVQGEWDWLNGADATLPSGQVLAQDDWGLSWQAGVNGRLTGMDRVLGADLWAAKALEGAQVSLALANADFGRDNDSRTLSWSLAFDLN